MKVVYLKGLSTNEEELSFIKDKFNSNGIEFINLVDDYSEFFNKSKEEIWEVLGQRVHNITWQTEPVTLVCHSMGCNYGLLLASSPLLLIKNVIFISPEFERITKAEQEKIVESTNDITKEPSQMKFGINKIKNISAFIKSSKWVPKTLNFYLNENFGPNFTTILYAKGDKYVSREIINAMSEYDNINSYEIDTNNHNPLLEDTNCIDIIKQETEKIDHKLHSL